MEEPLSPGEVTQLLRASAEGDEQAKRKFLEAVYGDLRRLAAHLMRAEKPGHTLQPTALVNEWMSSVLADSRDLAVHNRQHLMSVAVKAMRHLLVDHARGKQAQKRGGGEVYALQTEVDGVAVSDEKLLWINDALDHLAHLNQRQAQVAELRIFGGFSNSEIAASLQVTSRTVDRDWLFARGWLQMQLK